MMLITNRSIIFCIVHILPHNRQYNTKNTVSLLKTETEHHNINKGGGHLSIPYNSQHRQFFIIWHILRVGVTFPHHIILTIGNSL